MIVEFSADEFEVLEEFREEVTHERTTATRYFTLREQLDDLMSNLLPPDALPSQTRAARRIAFRAADLHAATTVRNASGVPERARFVHDPLQRFLEEGCWPDWVTPVVEVVMRPSEPAAPTAATELAFARYDLALQQLYRNALEPTAAAEHLTPAGRRQVVRVAGRPELFQLRGPVMVPVEDVPAKVSCRDIQEQAPDAVTLVPAQQRNIVGWLLGDRFAQPEEGPILDPAPKDTWFQARPVLFSSWVDLGDRRPRVADILAATGETNPNSRRVKKALADWGLSLHDVPWDTWVVAFPGEDKHALRERAVFPPVPVKTLDASNIPWGYSRYYSALTVPAWLAMQRDFGEFVRLMKLIDSLQGLPAMAAEAIVPVGPPLEQAPISIGEAYDGTLGYIEFVGRGIYRAELGRAVPVDIVTREQRNRLIGTRVPLASFLQNLEDMKARVARTYLRTGPAAATAVPRLADAAPADPNSPAGQIRRIEASEEFPASEKLLRIHAIVGERSSQEGVYYADDGSFLVCSHTLEGLASPSPVDALEPFIGRDGACKLCGEVLRPFEFDYSVQFDSAGRPIVTGSEVVPADPAEPAASPPETNAEILVRILQPAKHPEGKVLFIGIEVLGLEPDPLVLTSFAARMTAWVAGRAKAYAGPVAEFLRGLYGVAYMVLLLKTHEPLLRPSRILPRFTYTLKGFPRSREDAAPTGEADSPLLDYLLDVFAFAYRVVPVKRDARDPLWSQLVDNRAGFRKKVVQLITDALADVPAETQFLDEPAPMAAESGDDLEPWRMQPPPAARAVEVPVAGFPERHDPPVTKPVPTVHIAGHGQVVLALPAAPPDDAPGDEPRTVLPAGWTTKPPPPAGDLSAFVTDPVQEVNLTMAVLRGLFRLFLGRATPAHDSPDPQDAFAVLIPRTEVPEKEELRARLAAVRSLADGRLRAAGWLLDYTLGVLRRRFDPALVKQALENVIRWNRPAWGYSDDYINQKIQAAKSAERKLYVERLGALSDSERAARTALAPWMAVIDAADRMAIAADVDTAAAAEDLPPGYQEGLADNGDYGQVSDANNE